MEITLSPETEKAIKAALASGSYRNREDYAAEALRFYHQLKIDRLNELLAVGFQQLENGEIIAVDDLNAFFDQLDQGVKQKTG